MKKTVFATLAALAMSMAAPLSAATTSNLVVNGSFETVPSNRGDIVNARNWDVYSSIEGWNTLAGVSGSGIEIQTNPTLSFINAQDGGRYAELDSHRGSYTNSTIYQSLSLGAGTYELSFWYSPRENSQVTNGIDYAILDGVQSVVSGTVNGPSADVARGAWTQFSSRFTLANATDVTLQFAAVGDADRRGGLLDNVSIAPAPVPLPAAGWMLIAGVAGMGALRARGKKS